MDVAVATAMNLRVTASALCSPRGQLAHGPSQGDAVHVRGNRHGLLMHGKQRQCGMRGLLGAAGLIAIPTAAAREPRPP